jgi:hypothetical protein
VTDALTVADSAGDVQAIEGRIRAQGQPVRAKTPTFIAEFQLCATDERALRIRLDAGRNIYNAALGEALRRLDLMRESKAYQAARAMPKGKDRAAAFSEECPQVQG